MNLPRILIVIAAFALFITAGAALGKAQGEATATPIVTPTPFWAVGEQVNMVIVLVDDLQAAQPRLVGIWWAALAPKSPANLLPLYPNYLDNAEVDARLANNFGIQVSEGQFELGPGLTGTLQELGVPWAHAVVIDMTAMRQMLAISGQGDLDRIMTGVNDPGSASSSQEQFWQSVCQSVYSTPSQWAKWQSSLQGHSAVQAGRPADWAGWAALLENASRPTCSFPASK